MKTATTLNLIYMDKCVFCRVKLHKKHLKWCNECVLGNLCNECYIKHKEGHLREKKPSVSILQTIADPTFKVSKTGNSTGLF